MTPEELVRIANLRDACRSGSARALRISAGLSLRNVADATGNGIATLWRWETGDRQPLASPGALRYADLLEQLAGRYRPARKKEAGRKEVTLSPPLA